MATLCSIATGNASASGTWATCSSAAENDSEAATATVPTSTGGTSDSSTFVLAAGDYDAVAVKINNRSASPTGTISVVLRNSTTSTDVKTVTVNVSDLPNIQSLQGGWLVFKFGSNYTANGTDSFLIRVTTSSASMVTLYSSSGNNWARQVRSTTTAAPGSGDKMLVAGEYTGAGTSNSYTVTWDYTSGTHPTRFGAQTASATAIAVCSKGTLSVGTTASTAYYMKIGGILWLYPDATLNMGTSGTNMPSTSSFELIFDCVSNVDYGLEIRSGTTTSTWNAYGNTVTTVSTLLTNPRGGYCNTSGTAVTAVEGQSFTGLTGTLKINGVDYTISSVTDATHLTLTGSAGTQTGVVFLHAGTGTTLTVSSTSGWAANDVIAPAATARTNTQCEKLTISTVDSGTQVTTTGACTFYHGGTNDVNGDIRAEVIHLTRNIKIHGVSTSLQGYVNIPNNGNTSVVTLRYVEFYQLGSTTNAKRGIDVATTTGTFDMQYCSIHDGVVTGSRGVNIGATSGSNITVSNNVLYNLANSHILNVATSGVQTITNNMTFLTTDSGTTLIYLSDAGSTYTGNTAAGATGSGIILSEPGATVGTFSNNVSHSNSNHGIVFAAANGTLSGNRTWRNTQFGLGFTSSAKLITVNTLTSFGNAFGGWSVVASAGYTLFFTDCVFHGGATLTQPYGFDDNISAQNPNISAYSYNCQYGGGSYPSHTTADIRFNTSTAGHQFYFYNCLFAASTEFSFTSTFADSVVYSTKHDQNANSHKWLNRYGTGSIDTTLFDVTPAVRLTPTSLATSTTKFESQPITISLDSGANATVTVKVRKSAAGDGTAYGGNQPRLVLKKNIAAGITADVVLATASAATGTWETLTGNIGPSGTAGTTTTDHAGLQVVVDCDYGGSGGWVNIDTAAVS